jgi:hypothetical protein
MLNYFYFITQQGILHNSVPSISDDYVAFRFLIRSTAVSHTHIYHHLARIVEKNPQAFALCNAMKVNDFVRVIE